MAHLIRLILLAVVGLGSLYMLQLLAQRFNKTQKPVAKLARLLIGKRDLNAVLDNRHDKNNMDEIENFEMNWTQILKFDPFKCALALICEISAGAEKGNTEAENIKALIQYSIARDAPEAIDKAYKVGSTNPNQLTKCHEEYPYCPYSAKFMLKLLEIHSTVFGSAT